MTAPLTPAEHADALESQGVAGMDAYDVELKDGPVAARTAWRDSCRAVDGIRTIATTAATQAAALRAESADLARKGGREAAALKAGEANRVVEVAGAQIGILNDRAQALSGLAEGALRASVIPALPDSSTRALSRNEIDRVLGDKTGLTAVVALRSLASGDDPALTAEILAPGGYVERRLGPEHSATFRTLATAQVLNHPKNARAHAQVAGLDAARGAISAAAAAARLRLR